MGFDFLMSNDTHRYLAVSLLDAAFFWQLHSLWQHSQKLTGAEKLVSTLKSSHPALQAWRKSYEVSLKFIENVPSESLLCLIYQLSHPLAWNFWLPPVPSPGFKAKVKIPRLKTLRFVVDLFLELLDFLLEELLILFAHLNPLLSH